MTGYTTGNAARAQASKTPGDSFTPILVKRRKAPVKLRLLRGCHGKVVVFQAVPKLRD
jgi:hypothetical protein